MPIFGVPAGELDLPRNLALLDTNVLVALANPGDQHHEQARLFIDAEDRFELGVIPPVVVEACGLLSRRRDRGVALELLTWIKTPGNVRILPSPHAPLEVSEIFVSHTSWMQQFDLDYVDTYLMETANRISRACDLSPYLPIVTFDTGDFLRCASRGYSFSLYDMRVLDLQEFLF